MAKKKATMGPCLIRVSEVGGTFDMLLQMPTNGARARALVGREEKCCARLIEDDSNGRRGRKKAVFEMYDIYICHFFF